VRTEPAAWRPLAQDRLRSGLNGVDARYAPRDGSGLADGPAPWRSRRGVFVDFQQRV